MRNCGHRLSQPMILRNIGRKANCCFLFLPARFFAQKTSAHPSPDLPTIVGFASFSKRPRVSGLELQDFPASLAAAFFRAWRFSASNLWCNQTAFFFRRNDSRCLWGWGARPRDFPRSISALGEVRFRGKLHAPARTSSNRGFLVQETSSL